MNYICIALYSEAKPIIKRLNLKKKKSIIKWDIYFDEAENIALILTGVGPICAAAAVSALLTAYAPSDDSLLINAGACCSDEPLFSIHLINKLTDCNSRRTYYPDITNQPVFNNIAELDYTEAELFSSARPVEKGTQLSGNSAYDMEGAFIYQAASYYLRPDQMIFLKTVTDHGINAKAAASPEVYENAMSKIAIYIEKLFETSVFNENLPTKISTVNKSTDIAVLDDYTRVNDINDLNNNNNTNDIFIRLYSDFHASETMKNTLRQLYKYSEASGLDFFKEISIMYEKGLIPCCSKKEALIRLKQLQEALIYR